MSVSNTQIESASVEAVSLVGGSSFACAELLEIRLIN